MKESKIEFSEEEVQGLLNTIRDITGGKTLTPHLQNAPQSYGQWAILSQARGLPTR
jgi:hypothetical protein